MDHQLHGRFQSFPFRSALASCRHSGSLQVHVDDPLALDRGISPIHPRLGYFFGGGPRRKLHIAVDYFIAKLPGKTNRVFSLCSYSLILLFLSTVLWGALVMMEEAAPIFAGSIPWLSQMYLYLGAVMGVSFMIIFVSLDLGWEIRNARRHSRGQSQAPPGSLEI